MESSNEHPKRTGCMKFLGEYWALFVKMLILTKRKRVQTIVEILLAYIFLALLLGMRYLLDRNFFEANTIPPFRPFDSVTTNSTTANRTFYYPNNTCAQTIATNAINRLQTNVPGLSLSVDVIPDATLSTLSNSTLQTIYAYIYFTNLDSCINAASMPNQVEYTIRMQENGLTYYRPQHIKLQREDILWKRSPEDYCRDNTTTLNYTTQFLGVQYFVDLSIIQYVTNVIPDASSVYLNHFGCPDVYIDSLHTIFTFFVPLFYSIIYLITFLLNVGYIVEERANKTKEYLRIFGLRTWVNNFVWITRSMFIYLILTCICTALSVTVMKSSESKWNSVNKAIFNFSHWTLIWTILFVYSIQVSVFAVFFGQFFRRALLAKLVGIIIWIITFIDFYGTAPAGVRYFLCFFPNIGLLSCMQVLQQFERRSGGMATFQHLYMNIFDYPLYIGICLLLMLIYSVIFFFLAIYVERLNPGEFGVSQRWNYIFKKSYWTSTKIQPSNLDLKSDKDSNGMANTNHWIELNKVDKKRTPAMSIDHLNKKFGKFQAVTNLSLEFYEGEVYTLLGHNGAGKTTTTFILVGMLEPTSGRVTIQGFDNQLQIEKVRHYLGFCPQYDILYDELSVEEHLELVAKMRHMEKHKMKESIETILGLIGLTNDRNTQSKKLSGGMKRRLSIGISLINDPKVVILDEPTSGIDPYNRRLVWAIIKKLKMSGKCVLLTTHFLEEADVLSDRIAIMSRGRLQANGTPDFLKQQTEFEYRLLIDRQEHLSTNDITQFLHGFVPNIVLERESAAELVYGIKRGESKQIEYLINGLDQNKQTVGINSYGLSMTTIEDVFLRLVQEEEEHEANHHQLDDKVFRKQYDRVTGIRLFLERLRALLIKRWHISRRQISLFLGFFFLPILLEIFAVAVIPSPQDIQTSLTRNDRTSDSKITFLPSMYNPQTIISYANNNNNFVQTYLSNYLSLIGATIEQISTDTIWNYVRNRYHETQEIFLNKYQISFAGYDNSTLTSNAMRMNSYFSTVNYHTMPTSLTVASTNLFQFYANSSLKNIKTTNHPILTPRIGGSYISEVLAVFYCFEVFPITLFAFFNSIIAIIFVGVILLPIVAERLNNSKDLQLLTNLTRKTYWIANWIYDFCLCLILISLLTIVVKVGAEATTKTDVEAYVFRNSTAAGYFFLMLFMYVLASLPFAYVFSFLSKSTIMAFTNFFILNVIISIVDAIASSFPVFTQNPNPSDGPTASYRGVNLIRTIFAICLPSVNLKHAIANLVLHDNSVCIRISNAILGTKFNLNENFFATSRPGVGTEFILFVVQTIFWTIILIVIENKLSIKKCCSCQSDDTDELDQWKDSNLDEDVRQERQMILRNDPTINSGVIIVKDLIKKFKKKKAKSKEEQIYFAVNHVNFHVQRRACFGLLGANGAGKTTTFRMLVNDIKPSSGQIIINGKNINEMERDMEIGFCPQFDWLVYDLTVLETLYLFARLKGVESSEIAEMCDNIMTIFGLEMYEKRVVQKLSGGNKRKVSSALAFMANPALVFLDEPTTGLDAAAKRKLWRVIRAARDVGLTIIMTSHSMEECEALCTKIGIMKTGQFMCLGTLQRLRNRFGNGYTVQVKVAGENVENVKTNLLQSISGLEIQSQHNEMLFCNVPYVSTNTSFNLARVFEILNQRKEQKLIESYSVTQTSLEQIFVQLAGEDEEQIKEREKNKQEESQPVITRF